MAVSKFLKELSRKFLVMICMTQNRGPRESFTFNLGSCFLVCLFNYFVAHSWFHA